MYLFYHFSFVKSIKSSFIVPITSRLTRTILIPSLTGLNSTHSLLYKAEFIFFIVFSSILHLILNNISVGLGVVSHRRFQKRLRRVTCCPVPVALGVLIDPRRGAATLGVFAGAQLHISCLLYTSSLKFHIGFRQR